jgi:hypothetical protein
MKTIRILLLITILLIAAQLSFGQYQQHLHDNDSLYDWGWGIQNKPDNTYFIFGWSQDLTTGVTSLYNMNVSGNGSVILDKKTLRIDSMTMGTGNHGQLKTTVDGGYIAPLVKQWPNHTTGYRYSASGIIKYDASGDTVFTRTYTDTSVNFDVMYACAVMQNGDYMIGGESGANTPVYFPAYIIRTNSNGDTIWTHTYLKDPGKTTTINTLASLPNGHILVGAMVSHYAYNGSYTYTYDAPWFMELDSAGNIIKDTLYSRGFVYRGNIYVDQLGGYFHIGQFDSMKTSYPGDDVNFPNYIAHLDTNFRIEWITDFVIDAHYSHRYTENTIQLHDGNFLVIGEMAYKTNGFAWASKIDRTGKIMWNHYYVSDTSSTAYFRDVAEQPNGDLVFVGATWNDTLPAWHQQQDVWIVKTDSNGCIISGGCDPDVPGEINAVTVVPQAQVPRTWPNPATGEFTLSTSVKGALQVQLVAAYMVKPGNTELRLPASVSAGMYVCKFIPDNGSSPQSMIRLVYTP